MFDIMKSAAIDCLLNALEHGSKSCFMITSGGPLFLYHPDYKEDIKEAQSQYKIKEDEVVVEQPATVAEAVAAEVPAEREARVEATEASVPPGLAGAELNASRLPASAPNGNAPAPNGNANAQQEPRLNNRSNIDRNEGALNNVGPSPNEGNNAPHLGLDANA